MYAVQTVSVFNFPDFFFTLQNCSFSECCQLGWKEEKLKSLLKMHLCLFVESVYIQKAVISIFHV